MNLYKSILPVDEKGFYGEFGGSFVPPELQKNIDELQEAYLRYVDDPEFQKEFNDLLRDYVGRPSPLYFAPRLSEKYGTNVYLKREDLNHTGAHKINNAIGQALLAKRMGKKRIIAETGAGQHGVATATVCALMGLECSVYMGELDIQRQRPNVERMKMLGAKVIPATSGSKTLNDAVNEALEVDVNDVAVLSSTLTGQLTGVALLHTLQLGLNSLVRNSMDSLFNRQTIVAANFDFGLDSDLDGQGSALSLAGGIDGDLRTAHRLDTGRLDSLFVSCGEQLVDGVVGKDISAVHLLDESLGSLALAEALNRVLLALLLEDIGNCCLEGLSVDGELQLCHALLELFTLDEIHFVYPPLKYSIALGQRENCRLQPRTASLLLRNAGTRALKLGATIASQLIIARS